ncbi:O-antigen polymerase [Shouchella miscanthi]|uniref:O-antigen ligase n=1 Tax=Shouchella miscanthi TaxID=2598861 RepID=A0ABU6NQ67_9BACI|nr:O-antigen ligase [Shouchella miscanthi]
MKSRALIFVVVVLISLISALISVFLSFDHLNMLLLLIFVCLLIVLFVPILNSRDIFHPNSFVVVVFIYLYLFPLMYYMNDDSGLEGFGFHSISANDLRVGLIYIIIALSLYLIGQAFFNNFIGKSNRKGRVYSLNKQFNLNENLINKAIVIFTVVGILCFLYLGFIAIGIDTLLNSFYQAKQSLSGNYYFVWGVELFLIASLLMLFKNKPNLKIVFIHLIVGLLMISIFGSRGKIFYYLIVFLAIYHYRWKRISFKKGLVFAVVAVSMAALIYSFRVVSSEGISLSSFSDVIDAWFSGSEFRMLDMYVLVLRDSGLMYPHNFGSDYLNLFTSFIPRSIWQDKPVSIDIPLTQFYLPLREAGIPPTLIGAMYHNFNIFGILIGMFLIGLISSWVYSIKNKSSLHLSFYSVFIVMLFSYLRIGDFNQVAMFGLKMFLPILVILLANTYFNRKRSFNG